MGLGLGSRVFDGTYGVVKNQKGSSSGFYIVKHD